MGGQGDSMGCVGRASHVQTVTGALVAHTLLSSATVSKHVCQAQTSGYENWDCVPTDHLCVVLHNYNYHTQARNNEIDRQDIQKKTVEVETKWEKINKRGYMANIIRQFCDLKESYSK